MNDFWHREKIPKVVKSIICRYLTEFQAMDKIKINDEFRSEMLLPQISVIAFASYCSDLPKSIQSLELDRKIVKSCLKIDYF